MLKMYGELAAWWPLLSAPHEYEEEVDFFLKVLADANPPAAATMLELGSGGGNNALYLKRRFSPVTLTDLSPDMLAVSRALNPDCEHLQGDVRTLRLGRTFDFVFVHDAIDYMTTVDDLAAAIETAAIHCKPGGVALFVPDVVRETFEPSTEHGGRDEISRAMRYLEWTYDPDPSDTSYVTEYVFLLREGNQPARMEYERHVCGVFPRDEWLRLLKASGFKSQVYSDTFGRDLFLSLNARRVNRIKNHGSDVRLFKAS